MGWFTKINDFSKSLKDLIGTVLVHKEDNSKRQHEERMADIGRDAASLKQFSNEFHARENRTWWDSLVDGLNRLPRPLITIAVLSFFVIAPFDPILFLEIAKAYEVIPPGYWALLSIVVSFYFGGRMQLKSQDFAVKKDAVLAAKELIEMKKEFRQLDDELDSTESKIYEAAKMNLKKPIKNKVVEEWLKKTRTE